MTAFRWFCRACRREWIFKHDLPEDACICGSADIERVEYRPAFPGADLPRAAEQAAEPNEAPPRPSPVQPNLTIAATADEIEGVPI